MTPSRYLRLKEAAAKIGLDISHGICVAFIDPVLGTQCTNKLSDKRLETAAFSLDKLVNSPWSQSGVDITGFVMLAIVHNITCGKHPDFARTIGQSFVEMLKKGEAYHPVFRRAIDEACGICKLPMEFDRDDPDTLSELTWCAKACGKNVHANCMQEWTDVLKETQKQFTCCWCRSEWVPGSSRTPPAFPDSPATTITTRQAENSVFCLIPDCSVDGLMRTNDYILAHLLTPVSQSHEEARYVCSYRLANKPDFYKIYLQTHPDELPASLQESPGSSELVPHMIIHMPYAKRIFWILQNELRGTMYYNDNSNADRGFDVYHRTKAQDIQTLITGWCRWAQSGPWDEETGHLLAPWPMAIKSVRPAPSMPFEVQPDRWLGPLLRALDLKEQWNASSSSDSGAEDSSENSSEDSSGGYSSFEDIESPPSSVAGICLELMCDHPECQYP